MGDGSVLGATARPARAVERRMCRELVADIGHDPRLFDILTQTDPEHRPEYVRVAEVGGRPLSVIVVTPRRVLLAGAPVEGAILALGGTLPSHRGRGLMRLLLDDTMTFVRARGFRLAMLQSDPEFGRRFGFVACLGQYATTYPAARAVTWPSHSPEWAARTDPQSGGDAGAGLWRPATDGDAMALAQLFARATSGTPCTVTRSAENWIWRSHRDAGEGVHVNCGLHTTAATQFEPPGGLRAYVRWSRRAGAPWGALGIVEVGATNSEALAAALAWTGRQAIELDLPSVRFTGPPDHPFSRLAYLGAGAEVAVRAPGRGQVSVTNRGLLMADLTPTLFELAAAAGLPSGAGLVLDVGSKRFDLLLTGGRLRLLGGRAGRQSGGPASRLSAEAFTALITGYAGGDEIGALPGVTVAPAHRDILRALFPRRFPAWVPAPCW